jgi:hypothetical protein
MIAQLARRPAARGLGISGEIAASFHSRDLAQAPVDVIGRSKFHSRKKIIAAPRRVRQSLSFPRLRRIYKGILAAPRNSFAACAQETRRRL